MAHFLDKFSCKNQAVDDIDGQCGVPVLCSGNGAVYFDDNGARFWVINGNIQPALIWVEYPVGHY
jgi:hypothetical protein